MQTQTAIKTSTIHNQSYGIYNKDKNKLKISQYWYVLHKLLSLFTIHMLLYI